MSDQTLEVENRAILRYKKRLVEEGDLFKVKKKRIDRNGLNIRYL